jgi:hypothetical protein
VNNTKEEIRRDAPIPVAIRYENGIRYCTFARGQLESYVEKYPDAVAEVTDENGNFVRYIDTSVMRDLLVEMKLLPSGTHPRRSQAVSAD